MLIKGKHNGSTLARAAIGAVVSALAFVILLNAVFLILAVSANAVPNEYVVARVKDAFFTGDLMDKDHLDFDSRRGFHQYDDCLILQMILNRSGNIWADAVGPVVYTKDETWNDQCATLRRLVDENGDKSQYLVNRYARYWHGYDPISLALLSGMSLFELRLGLKATLYGALALLVIAAGFRHRGLLAVAAAIGGTGALWWGIPYFGQSMAHAPGDIFVILGIATLLFWRHKLLHIAALVPFCAAYGTGAVYLEFLTGVLPTAAGLLLAITYLLARLRRDEPMRPLDAWTLALAGFCAFALGGAATVIIKQALSLAFVGRDALSVFVGHLNTYTGPSTGSSRITTIHNAISLLLRQGPMLTYGYDSGVLLLYGTTAVAWFTAGCIAALRNRLSDFLAFVAGAAVIPIWVVLLPSHTLMHSPFMVRMLIVPISLGWAALAWQLFCSPNQKSGS